MHYANVENINVLYEMRGKKSQLRSKQPGNLAHVLIKRMPWIEYAR